MKARFGPGPLKLLQGMLGKEAETEIIIKALEQTSEYRLKTILKKNGRLRALHVPPPDLKKIQRLLLKRFFYLFKSKISPTMHGFVPQRSIVTNAKSHLERGWRHTIRLDLKDAFPSVKAETIRHIFQGYLEQEITDYAKQYIERKTKKRRWFKNIYHRHPIFPSRRVRWFRRLINTHLDLVWPHDIISRFLDLLVTLTTYQGVLPQGTPTSPFLLNLVISHFQIPQNISLIHQATINPSEDKDNRVRGNIAFLQNVYCEPNYGEKKRTINGLPKNILIPYLKYQDSLKKRIG